MHVPLHVTMRGELARLRSAELHERAARERRAAATLRSSPRRPLPRRED
jgi:hypothetical protein